METHIFTLLQFLKENRDFYMRTWFWELKVYENNKPNPN